MKYKWGVFWAIVACCMAGTAALGYIAYTSQPPSNISTFIEVTKTVFLCFGGLGVILPIYINATNAIEGRETEKIENTYALIQKWDDPSLFSARKLTRDIKDSRSSISDDDLVDKINSDDELRQSVILVFNYIEQVRFSMTNHRIDRQLYKDAVGPVLKDIIERFRPYLQTLSDQHVRDVDQVWEFLR